MILLGKARMWWYNQTDMCKSAPVSSLLLDNLTRKRRFRQQAKEALRPPEQISSAEHIRAETVTLTDCEQYVFQGSLTLCGDLHVDGRLSIMPGVNGTAVFQQPVTPYVLQRCLLHKVPKKSSLVVEEGSLFVTGSVQIGGSLHAKEVVLDSAAELLVGMRGAREGLRTTLGATASLSTPQRRQQQKRGHRQQQSQNEKQQPQQHQPWHYGPQLPRQQEPRIRDASRQLQQQQLQQQQQSQRQQTHKEQQQHTQPGRQHPPGQHNLLNNGEKKDFYFTGETGGSASNIFLEEVEEKVRRAKGKPLNHLIFIQRTYRPMDLWLPTEQKLLQEAALAYADPYRKEAVVVEINCPVLDEDGIPALSSVPPGSPQEQNNVGSNRDGPQRNKKRKGKSSSNGSKNRSGANSSSSNNSGMFKPGNSTWEPVGDLVAERLVVSRASHIIVFGNVKVVAAEVYGASRINSVCGNIFPSVDFIHQTNNAGLIIRDASIASFSGLGVSLLPNLLVKGSSFFYVASPTTVLHATQGSSSDIYLGSSLSTSSLIMDSLAQTNVAASLDIAEGASLSEASELLVYGSIFAGALALFDGSHMRVLGPRFKVGFLKLELHTFLQVTASEAATVLHAAKITSSSSLVFEKTPLLQIDGLLQIKEAEVSIKQGSLICSSSIILSEALLHIQGNLAASGKMLRLHGEEAEAFTNLERTDIDEVEEEDEEEEEGGKEQKKEEKEGKGEGHSYDKREEVDREEEEEGRKKEEIWNEKFATRGGEEVLRGKVRDKEDQQRDEEKREFEKRRGPETENFIVEAKHIQQGVKEEEESRRRKNEMDRKNVKQKMEDERRKSEDIRGESELSEDKNTRNANLSVNQVKDGETREKTEHHKEQEVSEKAEKEVEASRRTRQEELNLEKGKFEKEDKQIVKDPADKVQMKRRENSLKRGIHNAVNLSLPETNLLEREEGEEGDNQERSEIYRSSSSGQEHSREVKEKTVFPVTSPAHQQRARGAETQKVKTPTVESSSVENSLFANKNRKEGVGEKAHEKEEREVTGGKKVAADVEAEEPILKAEDIKEVYKAEGQQREKERRIEMREEAGVPDERSAVSIMNTSVEVLQQTATKEEKKNAEEKKQKEGRKKEKKKEDGREEEQTDRERKERSRETIWFDQLLIKKKTMGPSPLPAAEDVEELRKQRNRILWMERNSEQDPSIAHFIKEENKEKKTPQKLSLKEGNLYRKEEKEPEIPVLPDAISEEWMLLSQADGEDISLAEDMLQDTAEIAGEVSEQQQENKKDNKKKQNIRLPALAAVRSSIYIGGQVFLNSTFTQLSSRSKLVVYGKGGIRVTGNGSFQLFKGGAVDVLNGDITVDNVLSLLIHSALDVRKGNIFCKDLYVRTGSMLVAQKGDMLVTGGAEIRDASEMRISRLFTIENDNLHVVNGAVVSAEAIGVMNGDIFCSGGAALQTTGGELISRKNIIVQDKCKVIAETFVLSKQGVISLENKGVLHVKDTILSPSGSIRRTVESLIITQRGTPSVQVLQVMPPAHMMQQPGVYQSPFSSDILLMHAHAAEKHEGKTTKKSWDSLLLPQTRLGGSALSQELQQQAVTRRQKALGYTAAAR